MKTTTRTYRGVTASLYVGLILAAGVTAASHHHPDAEVASRDAARAAEPLPISACQTINRPGRYRLARDIEAATGSNCIEILAARVDLDLNGFRIVGSSRFVGTGVNANATVAMDTIIHNGSISGFWLGAIVQSGSVEQLQVSEVSNGLYVGSGAVAGNAIVAESIGVLVHSARVEDNQIEAGAAGITCSVSCVASGNRVHGREGMAEVATDLR